MESSGGQQQQVPEELTSCVEKAWAAKMQEGSQQAAQDFLKASQVKQAGPFKCFFNQKLDINRFFVAEGNSQNVNFGDDPNSNGQQTSSQQQNEPDFNIDDELDDAAMCVFKSGGVDEDLLATNDKQIMFYVDLEDEKIVSKQTADNKKAGGVGQQDDDDESAGDGKLHPVLLNQYPICMGHSLVLLFAEEGLPQVLSDELLVLVLQVFKMSNRPQLRIGYNSMGADCITNNLHFHMLTTDQLYPQAQSEQEQMMPIELAQKRMFFKTSLKHKNPDEINMYNCGVRFGELLDDFPLRVLLISPSIDDSEDISLEDAQEALAHCVGVVLQHMIDNNMPHNLLVTDEGMTVYVIPRRFDMLLEVPFFTSFETLCGYVKYKTANGYSTGASAEQITQEMRNQVSLNETEFAELKQTLMAKFSKEYSCEGAGEELAQQMQNMNI